MKSNGSSTIIRNIVRYERKSQGDYERLCKQQRCIFQVFRFDLSEPSRESDPLTKPESAVRSLCVVWVRVLPGRKLSPRIHLIESGGYKATMEIGIAVVVLLVVIGLVVVGVHNVLVARRNDVRDAWAGIDVQLAKRSQLVPDLVEVVKGYAGHERETLERVTTARAALDAATGVSASSDASLGLAGALRSVFALQEAYPDLKANTNFQDLQAQLADTEDKISYARNYYNARVRTYNTMATQIPSAIIANIGGFREAEFFEASEEGRQEVKVSFS